jgi:hypothetical protein
MAERYEKSLEPIITLEMPAWHPFSDQALLALAMIELSQGEPQQAQELAIKVMAEGLRTYLLSRIENEKSGEGVKILSSLEWIGISLFKINPQKREEKLRLGPFLTSISARETLLPIASEAAVVFIKRLIIQNLDPEEQRAFIAQVKAELAEKDVPFDPEIGVVRTLVSLCSGYPVIEVPWEEPAWSKLTGLQLIEREIGKRFTPQEYQQALARPFLAIQDFRAIGQVLARFHSEDQLPPLYLENREVFPSVPGKEIKWADFSSEAREKIETLFSLTVD